MLECPEHQNPKLLERLQSLKNIHHLSMIAILKPFIYNYQIKYVKIQPHMDHETSNLNGKICIFLSNDIIGTTHEIHDPHIT